jgi:hypothetical protein
MKTLEYTGTHLKNEIFSFIYVMHIIISEYAIPYFILLVTIYKFFKKIFIFALYKWSLF